MAQQAIGMIECKGLCALLEACDAALKAANVVLVGWEKIFERAGDSAAARWVGGTGEVAAMSVKTANSSHV